MSKPNISVVMTAYNEEQYIADAIDSVLNQKFDDFELIIVDDNSTDGTLEIVQEYKRRCKKVKVIMNERNQGQSISRNKALKSSSGDYIAIMDADDISTENRLNIQHKLLENNDDVFLCGSSCIKITEDGEEIGETNVPPNPEKKLPEENVMIHPSIMFRNNGQVEYRDKFEYSQDYDLYLRLISNGKKLVNTERPLIKYRITPNSVTQSNQRRQRYFAKKAKSFFNERKREGEDSYNSFTPKDSFSTSVSDITARQNYYEAVVISSLRVNNSQIAKKYLRRYCDISSNNKKKALLHLATSCPLCYRIYHNMKKISIQNLLSQLCK
jgi:glycosyltransferase involved in cell wall biosynthesis